MITKSDLAPKKITRIDVFYDHNKKPSMTYSPTDAEKVLKNLLEKMDADHSEKK